MYVEAGIGGHGELVSDVNVDVVTMNQGQNSLHQRRGGRISRDKGGDNLEYLVKVVRSAPPLHHEPHKLEGGGVHFRDRVTDKRQEEGGGESGVLVDRVGEKPHLGDRGLEEGDQERGGGERE